MQPWQVEGIDRLERSGYLGVLRNWVRSHTCPFWWYNDNAPIGTSILHNGTITFVNTGDRVLGISANHVYEEYLKDKANTPTTKCQFGSATVEPELYVVSRDDSLDVVTFELPIVLRTATGVAVHNAPRWPPKELQVSDLVILGGYPGHRRAERIGAADFDFVTMASRVSQCSENHVSIYLNMPHSYWPQGESLGEKPNLGGASGGPVFRLVSEPIEAIEFAGMIYESSDEYELLFARHAFHVNSFGKVQ